MAVSIGHGGMRGTCCMPSVSGGRCSSALTKGGGDRWGGPSSRRKRPGPRNAAPHFKDAAHSPGAHPCRGHVFETRWNSLAVRRKRHGEQAMNSRNYFILLRLNLCRLCVLAHKDGVVSDAWPAIQNVIDTLAGALRISRRGEPPSRQAPLERRRHSPG